MRNSYYTTLIGKFSLFTDKVLAKTIDDALEEKKDQIVDLVLEKIRLQREMSNPDVLGENNEKLERATQERELLENLKEYSEDVLDSDDMDYDKNLEHYRKFFQQEYENADRVETRSDIWKQLEIIYRLEDQRELELEQQTGQEPDEAQSTLNEVDMPNYFDDID